MHYYYFLFYLPQHESTYRNDAADLRDTQSQRTTDGARLHGQLRRRVRPDKRLARPDDDAIHRLAAVDALQLNEHSRIAVGRTREQRQAEEPIDRQRHVVVGTRRARLFIGATTIRFVDRALTKQICIENIYKFQITQDQLT